MSSNLPEFPDVSLQSSTPAYVPGPFVQNTQRKEWIIATTLFCLTLLCTSFAGLFYSFGDIGFTRALMMFVRDPGIILYGLAFSIPLISILLAHELGHYFACKYYGMNCTPPFFIPVPIPITGTLGAFIRIKSPFLNKRALFDIGVSGPLAGFCLTVPFLCIGIGMSKLVSKGAFPPGNINYGEPLIFRFVGALLLGYSPGSQDMVAHPIAMAAWVGLLATSLNLLPVWQLDGGHITYAILGRARHKLLTIVGIAFLVLLSLRQWPTPSYLLFALMLLLFGWRSRFYHPRTLFEDEPVGDGRIAVGLVALLILIASFIPVPISFG